MPEPHDVQTALTEGQGEVVISGTIKLLPHPWELQLIMAFNCSPPV